MNMKPINTNRFTETLKQLTVTYGMVSLIDANIFNPQFVEQVKVHGLKFVVQVAVQHLNFYLKQEMQSSI